MNVVYSLELHFDVLSTTVIQQYINLTANVSGNDYMLQHKIPPHLTVAFFETDKIDYVCKLVAGNTIAQMFRKEQIAFPAIGAFVPQTLFLVSKQSEYLSALNSRLCSELNDMVSHIPFYLPNNWIPHCTIATQLMQSGLKQAFSVLSEQFTPLTATIASVAIVKCEPYDETIWEFAL